MLLFKHMPSVLDQLTDHSRARVGLQVCHLFGSIQEYPRAYILANRFWAYVTSFCGELNTMELKKGFHCQLCFEVVY